MWIAASGLAALAGGAFYLEGNDDFGVGDDGPAVVIQIGDKDRQANIAKAEQIAQVGLERARLTLDEALKPDNSAYDRELAKLEPAIASGQLTRAEAIDLAVNRAAAAAPANGKVADPAVRAAMIEKARAGLDQAHEGVDALLESGAIERPVHDRLYLKIEEASEKLDEQAGPAAE